MQAFHEASSTKMKPTAIIAKTYKGRNFPSIEDEENWHGKPLGDKSEAVVQVSTSFNIYWYHELCFNITNSEKY